ncbi:glutathione S-transferase family protein [Oricola cellulosilytica]|uniref:Glutathione S-transferase family protein n=1 Tax=Oricola cellulosilytica TaxID=1429082 RepID=A0A4R0PBA4_9HYPH|nr:glutathione S-transferase family protein [Oricola cellulosilytica]TCD14326.1 glutathione S-transferase family protein [Oricola cellulosilytica]
MPHLLYSPASPYSAKVRMAVAWLGLDIDNKIVNTSVEPPDLVDNNPLGKIPTLVLNDGAALFDSRAIMQELDRMSGKRLFPRNAEKRREAEKLEALADGICDCLLAQIYEKRFRPEEKVHQPWLDLQARKAERGLDWLEENAPRVTVKLHGGQFAMAAMFGYLDLRFEELNWRRGRPKLRRFEQRFAARFDQYERLKPGA